MSELGPGPARRDVRLIKSVIVHSGGTDGTRTPFLLASRYNAVDRCVRFKSEFFCECEPTWQLFGASIHLQRSKACSAGECLPFPRRASVYPHRNATLIRVYLQSIRLAFAMVCLGASLILASQWFGLLPDANAMRREHRRQFSEAVAIQAASHIRKQQWVDLRAISETLVDRDVDLVSIGIRSDYGQLKADAGHHQEVWEQRGRTATGIDAMTVPITLNRRPWGHVELCFHAPEHSLLGATFEHPLIRLLGFYAITGIFVYTIFIGRVMNVFSKTQVVPDRVRQALDTLAEGLLVLDEKSRIILANRSFADTVNQPRELLVQTRAEDLPWVHQSADDLTKFPWTTAISESLIITEQILHLEVDGEKPRIFSVNAAPIEGDGSRRGALATFRDVTMIVEHREQLEETLTMLSASRDQIEQKNRELEILATQDALTGCLNRRAFFEKFGRLWKRAQSGARPLSCIMVDNDHFKNVNDTYGHGVGDDVLREVARVLRERHNEMGLVCRYGGEEFCILLPDVELETAIEMAEATRKAIEEISFDEPSELKLSASIGVTETRFGATDPQDLVNQADICLYIAKDVGRNCVVAYDPAASKLPTKEAEPEANHPSISDAAIEALVASLAYRDPVTAQHCRRVAALCECVGKHFMDPADLETLRAAALLHDIGKLGVPDYILLKRGQLTSDEIELINQHDRLGVEMVGRAFGNDLLTQTLRCRRAQFNGFGPDQNLPSGREIPLASRLLAICDSYDAMVTDQVYRKGCSHEIAIEELRRFADAQFDGELVEHFASVVDSKPDTEKSSSDEINAHLELQVERLGQSVDEGDTDGVRMLSSRLVLYARRCQAETVSDAADRIHLKCIQEEVDWAELLNEMNGMMKACQDVLNGGRAENASAGTSRETDGNSGDASKSLADFGESCSLMKGIPVPIDDFNSSY